MQRSVSIIRVRGSLRQLEQDRDHRFGWVYACTHDRWEKSAEVTEGAPSEARLAGKPQVDVAGLLAPLASQPWRISPQPRRAPHRSLVSVEVFPANRVASARRMCRYNDSRKGTDRYGRDHRRARQKMAAPLRSLRPAALERKMPMQAPRRRKNEWPRRTIREPGGGDVYKRQSA